MGGAFHLFTIKGVPVYANVWYLLLLLFFGYRAGSGMAAMMIVLCITLSLLIHEFGHAVVASYFRLKPRILLHGFGGLCQHEPTRRNRDDALIIAAGPGAQLLYGGICWGVLQAVGPESGPMALVHFLSLSFWISVVWAALNLLPIWPLDGGQLFKLGTERYVKGVRGQRMAHQIGIGVAVAGAIYGLSIGWAFTAIIAIMLAWTNLGALSQLGGARVRASRGRRASASPPLALELLAEAHEALADEDWREAARLAHQVRDQPNISDKVQGQVFAILAITSFRMGDYQDAIDYAGHAPQTPAVSDAVARARERLAHQDDDEDDDEEWT